MTTNDIDFRIAREILNERERQDKKWGDPKDLPNGTGPNVRTLAHVDASATFYIDLANGTVLADAARTACDARTTDGTVTYADILLEEHFEALAEEDPEKLFDELIQVSAVAQKWCRALIEHQGVQR